MKRAAVVTAGGRVDGAFARALGTPVKALAPIADSTMLQRSICALRGAGIERIAVVGGPEVRAACAGTVDRFVDEAPSGGENLLRALRVWEEDAPLLYLTSDMPFVNADAIARFLAVAPPDALAMPLTEWSDFERRFPGAPPFGIAFGSERVVNGGAFAIPAGAAPLLEALAVKLFDARKNPWKMAQITGIPFLLQFAFKRLRIEHLETHAQRLLGIRAQAVRGAPPELAYDVDVYEEYLYALARS